MSEDLYTVLGRFIDSADRIHKIADQVRDVRAKVHDKDTLRTRIATLEAENAGLIHLRSLVAKAFGVLGPTGYFPSMGAPLSDEIRNVLAKDCPDINAVSGSGADRAALREG